MKPIFFILSLLFFFFSCGEKKKREITIAYVGRFTDDNSTKQIDNRFDKAHELMIQHFLDEVNTKNDSIKLILKSFDCKRTPEGAAKVYDDIAKDTQIVAIIDNTWGVHLRGAQPIIKAHNLPTIAINGDRNNLDFGQSAIFTGNNDMLPSDITLFVNKILKTKEVVFISEKDYPLHEVYLDEFKKSGIKIIDNDYCISNGLVNKDSIALALFEKLKETHSKDPSLVSKWHVLNVHYDVGGKLLDLIDAHFNGMKLIGHAYNVPSVSQNLIKANSTNELILVNNPTDAVSLAIASAKRQFEKNKPELFENLNSPMFADRCQQAVSILANTIFTNGQLTSRSQAQKAFSRLRNNSLYVKTDILYFNEKNELTPNLFYVKYKEGRLYSYREQLNSNGEVVPNLVAGMEIIDLYNIDVSTNTFMADFYYWIKADTANIDAERFVLFPNMKEEGSSSSLVLEKIDNGQSYKLYKVSGLFHQDFDLKNYPFDRQEIMISMEIMAPSEKIKIAFDQSAFKQDTNLLEKFVIRAWEKDYYLLTVDNRISSTMRGDPESVEGQLRKFNVFSFRLFVDRSLSGPFLEIVLPLLLIGLVAISLLFVRDISFGNVGEVSVGTFLGIITFSIAIASVSPSSDYLTKSDILFWLTFGVVLLCFLIIIGLNAIYDEEELKNVKVVKRTRIMMLITYLLASALVIIW
ncbi:MAG: hypothetical protein SNJ77_05000 [Cytophagales bacterium]